MRRLAMSLVVLAVLVSFVAACAAPTPQVIEKEVIVEKEVPVTVEVEKEVVVEKKVIETVEVVKEVVVEKEEVCEKPRYVVTSPLIHPYHTTMQMGAEAAAADLGVELVWFTPAGYDVPKQVEMTESALSLPCVEGLTVLAADPLATEGALKEAADRGITIAQCSACWEGQVSPVCYMTDLEKTSGDAAERLAKEMGGKGKVVIAGGDVGNVNHEKMINGAKDRLEQNYPDIEILEVLYGCDNVEGTVACAETALSAYPEMDAYFTAGMMSSVGATQVFPAAGRDDIIVTANDDAPEVVEGIRNGAISFSYVQPPWCQGYMMVYIPWLMRNKGLVPTVQFFDSGVIWVDKSNVDTYQSDQRGECEKLKEYVETVVLK